MNKLYGDVRDINYFTVLNSMSVEQQLEVWSWVFGRYVNLYQDVTSPFRPDKKPNCHLREYRGRVLFTDFADVDKCKYTCIHAVAHLNCTKLNPAALKIQAALDFEIKLFDKSIIKQDVGKTKSKKSKKSNIHFIPYTRLGKPVFTKTGAKYWKKRFAKKRELKGVYEVSHFFVDEQMYIPKVRPCFALTCNSRVKIYQPYNPEQKWISNTTKDDVWHFEQFSNVCVITSSFKDCLPWYRYTNYNVDAFQNEGMVPSENDYTQYDYIILNFDNDSAGIRAAYKMLNKLKYKYAKVFFFPTEYGKDPDEVLMNVGEEEFKKLIKDV